MSDPNLPSQKLPGALFATVPATDLRIGDLIHLADTDAGCKGYVLVAQAVIVDDLVHLMLYDSQHPHGRPVTYRADERLMLACRDLIEPDNGATPWTDARWRWAHRRGAAIALLDQIHARSIGRPAVVATQATGSHHLQRRGPLPPRVLTAEEITDLLGDGPPLARELDIADPAVRAILTLSGRVKAVEQPDGSWSGGEVVAILTEWFDALGLPPDRPVADLVGRVVSSADSSTARAAAVEIDESPGCGGFGEVDLDRIADLVRSRGVDCEIDTPGGGVAVLLAGRPTCEPAWAFPWAVQVGPGRFCWDAPSTGSLRDLRIGPDTPDPMAAVLLAELGVTSEEQIADAVLVQVRLDAASDRAGGTAG